MLDFRNNLRPCGMVCRFVYDIPTFEQETVNVLSLVYLDAAVAWVVNHVARSEDGNLSRRVLGGGGYRSGSSGVGDQIWIGR
jgi:hypothetical protein